MSYFQDWISTSFRPCGLVFCSEKAKKIIEINNLTPSEFLRPFGDFRNKNIQIQFNEKDKEPISINNFIIDFYDNEKFKQVDKEFRNDYIKTMLELNKPNWNLSSPLITKNNVDPIFKLLKHYSTPWFGEFEKTFLECLHFDEYELYQQPLINIFIVSIEEETSIINNNLCKHFPKLISEKKYEFAKENIVITLNNCKDEILEKDKLDKCKYRFEHFLKSYHIFFWDINCQPYSSPKEGEQKRISENFKKYFHKTDIYNKNDERYKDYQKKEYGMYINAQHYKQYREEFFDYFNKIFIKHVLERVNQYLSEIKKYSGISRIFKKNNEVSYYSKTNMYKFTDLERLYYNLGLIYFYFHNYDAANDIFKSLRNTLKEKSKSHKERVKEIKAICKFLQKKDLKKEYNVLEEMNVLGRDEQIIRTEIIVIKMMENKLKLNNKEANFKLLTDTINHFIKSASKRGKNSCDSIFSFFSPLLHEKLAIYNLYENKFRKFVFYMTLSGKNLVGQGMLKNYSLFYLSNLIYFLDNPSSSFSSLRLYFNKMLGDNCSALKYVEGKFKFHKNCLEFVCFNENEEKKENKEYKSKYMNYYLSAATQIKNEKIITNNVDLNELNIPQVDNASLFILENDDYNIKEKARKMLGTDDRSWLVFNKYGVSLTTDVYVNLDENDLDHIKLIHDLTNQTNKVIANVHTDRYFHGNINQKLFVKCTIRNPLPSEIQESYVKLFCQFIPQKSTTTKTTINNSNVDAPVNDNNNNENKINIETSNININDKRNSLEKNININKIENTLENNEQDQDQNQQHLSYSTNEEPLNLKPGEIKEIELNVSSPVEGKIIIKGLEFRLFRECKIIHLFSKKTTPSLYYYYNRKKMYTMGGASSGSSSDYESRNSSELTQRNLTNNFIIPRKNKIEYIVHDFKNDLFVTFPLGTNVNVFLYQLFFFPIVVHNNSVEHRVRRYTIFIEDCDKDKVKTFFNFITKDNKIKQRFTSEEVLIPIIPLATGKIYIKILIKFSGEMRVKPIQVKRFLIRLKVKESISFEVKEYCSNLKIDKDGKTYNKIDFNIKTNLRIRNQKEIKNLVMEEPVFNKELNLLNQKQYLITNNEIHKKFVFVKDDNSRAHGDIKYNLDFITKNINIENNENDINNQNENNNNTIKPYSNNNYIIDRFNKTLNNPNGNIIFFPWKATHIMVNESDKNNNDENNDNNPIPKEVTLQGLYPYKLKMENSEATKIFLTYLFNKYTELNITHKKIDNEKTLIKLIIKLNKVGLSSMGDKIDKYEISANDSQPQIIWLGPKKFIVKNNLDENTFTCRFNFITSLKGNIEINRISVFVYKKPENKGDKVQVIELKHITKPASIFIE